MAVIAEAVKHMLNAGMPAEAIVAAIADMESAEKPQDASRKERNHRYYEKKKAELSRLKTSYASYTSDAPLPSSSPLVPPLSPIPLSPPLIPPSSSNPAKTLTRARTKVSLDELSVDHIKDWLAKKRIQGRYLQHDEYFILEQFKDYCHANGKKYDDYCAAFRNAFGWERFGKPGSGDSSGKQPHVTNRDRVMSAIFNA